MISLFLETMRTAKNNPWSGAKSSICIVSQNHRRRSPHRCWKSSYSLIIIARSYIAAKLGGGWTGQICMVIPLTQCQLRPNRPAFKWGSHWPRLHLNLGDVESAGLLAEGVGAGVVVGTGVEPNCQNEVGVVISAKCLAAD